MSTITKLDTRELDGLINMSEMQAPEIVKAAAYDVQAQTVMNAPYDTGFHSNSILAEEVDKLTWRISMYAEYGIWLELGTNRMAPRPHLVPAIERAYDVYINAWKRLFK